MNAHHQNDRMLKKVKEKGQRAFSNSVREILFGWYATYTNTNTKGFGMQLSQARCISPFLHIPLCHSISISTVVLIIYVYINTYVHHEIQDSLLHIPTHLFLVHKFMAERWMY